MMYPVLSHLVVSTPPSFTPSCGNPNLWPISCATVVASAASFSFRTMDTPVEAMEQQFNLS